MTTKKTLQHIAAQSPAFRSSLRKLAQLHSEKQCNGEYYFDDDKNAWIGYTGAPDFKHSTTNTQAKEGEAREDEIRKKMLILTGTKEIPDFIGYSGDPRGFVLKIHSDKLSEDEIKLCAELDFMRDWGGDFTIVKDSEWI